MAHYDDPYNETFLEAMRDILHQKHVKPNMGLTRQDYKIYWTEDESLKQGDYKMSRGGQVHILYYNSPYDGKLNERLTRSWSKTWPIQRIKDLMIGKLVTQKDAIRMYGIEVDKPYIKTPYVHTDMQHHEITLSYIVEVTIKHKETGKRIKLSAKNTDGFTLTQIALRKLYEV